ncbi:amidohydrolase family protein [Nonomuraea basaltis]|uniref:amidohydrolase family protein n=1 Tax=Nonomuraea basaltis TaxID=2495887 RepID=UPI001F119128|nr:amidohydrolase family protein [Nonomuraea basaltis]
MSASDLMPDGPMPDGSMTVPYHPPLRQVLETLGGHVLSAAYAPDGEAVTLREPIVHDPEDPLDERPGCVLLAVGARVTSPDAHDLVRQAARLGYHAVVVKDRGADLGPLVDTAKNAGIALLIAPQRIPWRQLDALLTAAISGPGSATTTYSTVAIGDLFALANAIAATIGGATTIEDPQGNVLGYSNIPGQEKGSPARPAHRGADMRGRLETPPGELYDTMSLAWSNGVEPAVHAIGDLAASIALDAFERVGCAGRIEHAQLLRAADFARFARPGLIAGVQPAHAPDDREVADRHWAGRTHRAFAYADLLDAGAALELGSDAPVAPLDPWDGMAAAIARTDDERPPWHSEQAVPLPAALAAASRGRHGVKPGDPADLVITATDPADLDPAALPGMEVLGTLLNGRWTYRQQS